MAANNLGHSRDNSSPVYYYQAFGLTIASALLCPELLPGEGPAEVTIRYGAVPDALEDIQQQGDCYQVNAEAFFLKLNSIAKYLVTAGEQIIIEPVPGVQDGEVRLFLLAGPLRRCCNSAACWRCTAAPWKSRTGRQSPGAPQGFSCSQRFCKSAW